MSKSIPPRPPHFSAKVGSKVQFTTGLQQFAWHKIILTKLKNENASGSSAIDRSMKGYEEFKMMFSLDDVFPVQSGIWLKHDMHKMHILIQVFHDYKIIY